MPLPAGFKVNGSKIVTTSSIPVTPLVRKIIDMLDAAPLTELFTTMEISERMGRNLHGGGTNAHSALRDYREKVDGKLFWGSRKSIAQLRQKLVESEDHHDEN